MSSLFSIKEAIGQNNEFYLLIESREGKIGEVTHDVKINNGTFLLFLALINPSDAFRKPSGVDVSIQSRDGRKFGKLDITAGRQTSQEKIACVFTDSLHTLSIREPLICRWRIVLKSEAPQPFICILHAWPKLPFLFSADKSSKRLEASYDETLESLFRFHKTLPHSDFHPLFTAEDGCNRCKKAVDFILRITGLSEPSIARETSLGIENPSLISFAYWLLRFQIILTIQEIAHVLRVCQAAQGYYSDLVASSLCRLIQKCAG